MNSLPNRGDRTKLKSARRGKGWSQEQMANKTGYALSVIQKLEQGKYGSLECLRNCAEALDIPLDALLEEPDNGTDCENRQTIESETSTATDRQGDKPPPDKTYEVTIETVNLGKRCVLKVPMNASVAWLVRQAQAQLGLHDYADTGGFTRIPIRWILVETRAEEYWLRLPVLAQRIARAVVASENGPSVTIDGGACLRELGVKGGNVFHLYGIEAGNQVKIDSVYKDWTSIEDNDLLLTALRPIRSMEAS